MDVNLSPSIFLSKIKKRTTSMVNPFINASSHCHGIPIHIGQKILLPPKFTSTYIKHLSLWIMSSRVGLYMWIHIKALGFNKPPIHHRNTRETYVLIDKYTRKKDNLPINLSLIIIEGCLVVRC